MTSSTAFHPDNFEEFYQAWFPKAVAIARRRGLSDAEAAAQEVLLVFFTQDYLDPKGRWARWHDDKLDAWIRSIVYRRLLSIQRKELRRKTIAPMVTIGERQLAYPPTEEIFSAYGELKDMARGVLAQLQDDDRLDLAPLWVAIVRQFTSGEMHFDLVSQKNLAADLGWSKSEVSEKMCELREWMSQDLRGDITGVQIDRAYATTG